ncbi:MAG: two-partner secretion system transporter TpsB2 [Candidatus Pelagadaptatus aseana]
MIGKCLTLKDINTLLDRVSAEYFSRGYITSRAYLREQNLADGDLQIDIVEGTFAGIEPGDTNYSEIFSLKPGQLLNLRDIEQGVDHINRLQSMQASVRLLPGKALGQSLLQVKHQRDRPWELNFTVDNSGQEATGESQLQGFLGWDSPLGLYDYTYFSLQSDSDFGQGKHRSRSLSWHWDLPLGLWTVALDYSHFEYRQEVTGRDLAFESSGMAETARLNLKRLLHRNQQSKWFVTASLKRHKTRNYIEDVLIDVSSRVLSSAELKLTWDHYFSDGSAVFSNVAVHQGIETLSQVSGGVSDFTTIVASVDLHKPVDWMDHRFSYRSRWLYQYSDDALYASEQISIGSLYTVRGFKQETLSGNRGGYWRNSLYWHPVPDSSWEFLGTITPFVGVDIGAVQSSSGEDYRDLAGVVIGAQLSASHWSLDFLFAQPLHQPDEFERRERRFDLSFNYYF